MNQPRPSRSTRPLAEFAIALLILSIPSIARSTIDVVGLPFPIAFSSNTIDPGVSFSSGWSATSAGLRAPIDEEAFGDVWVETQRIAIASGGLGLTSVSLDLSIEGRFSDMNTFPRHAFVRYSSDGHNWTFWQAFVDLDGGSGSANVAPRHFRAHLAVPGVQRLRYGHLKDEWRKSNRIDQERFFTWIQANSPEVLAGDMPFIGFVQLRFEGYSGDEKTPDIIREAVLRVSYSVGGFSKLFR